MTYVRSCVMLATSLVAGLSACPPTLAVQTMPAAKQGTVATGQTACGEFVLRATAAGRLWPLLSCSSAAGINPLRTIRTGVGETVTTTNGEGDVHVILDGSDPSVAVHGLVVTGTRKGDATVTETGRPCAVVNGVEPKTCSLMRVTVH